MAGTQSNRFIGVTSPLGDDVLLFRRMTARESLGRLFEIELELLSSVEDVKIEDVLGQNMTVRLEIQDGSDRYLNGFCSEFSQSGRLGRYAVYQAILRPWLWFLTRTADCRIFQEVTVPDIIKEVFREHGFSDFEESLSNSYRTWEYCVQYRETDFNFVSRLMEQEGIYYFFKHEDGKHMLVLADSYSAHDLIPAYEKVPYYPPSENVEREEDCITDWYLRKTVKTGNYVLESFDFKKPKAELVANSSISRKHARADFEMFDYPGEYVQKSDGDQYVRARLEELQAEHERVQGEADTRGFAAGGLFELVNYSREDQNREYLLVSVTHTATVSDYESGTGGADSEYSCSFEAQESKTPFRTPRTTRKPFVQGPQTAIVVGPSGEEIHTDEYGRVKVQFHWDRYGKADENASCWVRVSQVWAGKQWGAMHIPRMGHEVIVDFLEGDPDQPIVTGRVYNADNMPPYGLPDNKTQSGLKSRSSKEGTPDNFNEIRFEDKKGGEEMYIHAEKNQTIVVENDKSESVGHDNTESIGNDETIEVGNNRAKTVGVNQSEAIGSNKTIDVGANHSETIGANKTLSVGANHTESIGANMTIDVGANKTETVAINTAETIGVAKELSIGAAYQVSVGAAMSETIGASKTENIGAGKSVSVGSDSSEQIGSNQTVAAGKDIGVTSGKKMSFTAGDDFAVSGAKKGLISIADELTIQCGKAVIQMKKNGDILIDGKKIDVKGSGDIVMKGKKILQN
jgi:type VI secretion system secreted protein VgrG